MTELAHAGLSTELRVGVDRLEIAEPRQRADRFLSRLGRLYVGLHYFLCGVFVMFGAIWLVRRTRSAESMLFMLLAAAIFARIGLFAILDASSWSGSQARYMLPIFPFFGVASALGLIYISRLLAVVGTKLKL